MNMIIKTFIAVLSLLLVVSCRQTDVRTFTINVPDMKNRACATVIVKALSSTVGVKGGSDIKVDLVARTVTVDYESLVTAKKNIEFAVADAGFNANSVPANPEAVTKLPPECVSGDTMINLPAYN